MIRRIDYGAWCCLEPGDALRAYRWHGGGHEGALVIGTLDAAEATQLAEYACGSWFQGAGVKDPVSGRWLLQEADQRGERCWTADEDGEPGVMFTWDVESQTQRYFESWGR